MLSPTLPLYSSCPLLFSSKMLFIHLLNALIFHFPQFFSLCDDKGSKMFCPISKYYREEFNIIVPAGVFRDWSSFTPTSSTSRRIHKEMKLIIWFWQFRTFFPIFFSLFLSLFLGTFFRPHYRVSFWWTNWSFDFDWQKNCGTSTQKFKMIASDQIDCEISFWRCSGFWNHKEIHDGVIQGV